MTMTSEAIERLRDRTYRRSRARRVRTLAQAAEFIDSVGFCLLFASTQGIELPSLFEAVKGRRDAFIEDWDADSDKLWGWKTELPATRQAYYGKALASGKPVLISLKMLPALIAITAPAQIEQAYREGRISQDALRVHRALESLGPTPTMALRAAAGLDRPGDNRRYHRALDELQRQLIVAPVGATNETGAWTSQIFGLVARWFPAQMTRAQKMDLQSARRTLATRYFETVTAATPRMLGRVFGWRPEVVEETAADLLKRRRVTKKKDGMIFYSAG